MKTRRNVSKWPNFFDKSQQDELTGLWLRARVLTLCCSTSAYNSWSRSWIAQQSGRRERQRDSWRWRRIRWARTSRLEPESSRNGSRSPWIEPRRRWARGDPLFKKVSLSPRNFLTVPESHCHGSVKLWDGHIELVLLSCSVLRAGKASMREGERPWHHVPTMTGFWNRVSLLSRVIGWKKSPTDFTFVISVCERELLDFITAVFSAVFRCMVCKGINQSGRVYALWSWPQDSIQSSLHTVLYQTEPLTPVHACGFTVNLTKLALFFNH